MFVLGNFLNACAQIIDILLNLCFWLILIRALISWVNPDPYNPIVQFLMKTTEPMLYPIRRRLGLYSIGIDLSPFIVILIIFFLRYFLVRTLIDISLRLR
ncbi:MAG: YggT family protein [Candidatus Omnitrophica bacterium]|nr:YggT family protein [Candidatus Omnitrophota bacterium]